MRLSKKICVKQHDITDCGAACLSSVGAYYGHQIPIARIRQWAYTTRQGTNILGLIEAAKQMDLSAKGVRASFEAFSEIPLPAIAHVIIDQKLSHFIVVYKVTNKEVLVMDPGYGEMQKMTHDSFRKIWTGILVILAPMTTFHKENENTSVIARLFQLAIPHKAMLLQAMVGSVVCSILGLSTSVYIGKITDYVLVDGNVNLLNLLSICMIVIILLKGFIGIVRSLIASRTGQLINASLIMGYYKHVLQLPQVFYDTMRVGEIISRINDAGKISNFINETVLSCIVNTLIVLFTVAFMFLYSVELTLIILASVPFFLLIFWIYNKLNKKYQRSIMEKGANLQSQLVESINSIGTVKRFGLESYSNLKTETRFVTLLKDAYTSIQSNIYIGSSMEIVSSLITIAAVWYGTRLVLNNEMTPGALMMFYSLVGYLMSPIISLISANRSAQDAMIAVDRLFQIMDLEIEEEEQGKIEITKEMKSDIRFEDVWFRYGTRKYIFENLNLSINHGNTIAIVGKSGSGKTTLGSLLQHLYPIEKGRVLIGGYDIAQISNRSLRQYIATVPQRIELFAGSLIENIALGDFEPDIKRIADILKLLHLDEFVQHLPEGLNTMVGERGVSLSGGESQRIAIARALYRKPTVLILDEATSSLDSIAENAVKDALEQLKETGMTIITIAHRMSTVRNADSIIVLDCGKVVEQGNHNELLNAGGYYAKLWEEQTLPRIRSIIR